MKVKERKTKKKAEIQVSMHWIFILIIGAIILTFFITVSVKQKSISDEKLLLEFRKGLNSYISGAQTSSQSATLLPNLESDIYYGCFVSSVNNRCNCKFEIEKKGRVAFQTRERVVFSTSHLPKDEEEMLVWNLEWRMPYPVTNFLYMTSPGERVIVGYEPLYEAAVEEFYDDSLSDKLNKELVPASGERLEFRDQGDYKIRILYFGNSVPKIPGFAMTKDTVIIIASPLDPLGSYRGIPKGTVSFYRYDKNSNSFVLDGDQTNYVGIPSLVGAIFSDNVQDYNCAMQSAFRNLNSVNKVFMQRVKLLDQSGRCTAFYGPDHLALFNSVNENTKDPSDWQNTELADLLSVVDELEKQNEIIGAQSCPLLY